MASSRLPVSLLALALIHAACSDSSITAPASSAPATDAAAGLATSQSVPRAVFLTTPPAEDGRIEGASPLEVQFNLCRSRAGDPGDELKFTYDFDADGTVDELGHCRARHTFTASSRARACVSDRRPDGIVCRTYAIELSAEPEEPPAPEHVLRLSLNSCGHGARYQYLEGSITPRLPAGQSYAISLTVDGDLGAARFLRTVAFVDDSTFTCEDFSGYRRDDSPLPNEHVVDMPAPRCSHERIFVFSAIESVGLPLAERLQTTVTGFQVPGRRTRIEGQTIFTCP